MLIMNFSPAVCSKKIIKLYVSCTKYSKIIIKLQQLCLCKFNLFILFFQTLNQWCKPSEGLQKTLWDLKSSNHICLVK